MTTEEPHVTVFCEPKRAGFALLVKQIGLFASTMIMLSCHSSLTSDIQQAYSELPEIVDFNFHIRPLLTDRCYKCHGPDENTREANLRLDTEDAAFAPLSESTGYAIVPGSRDRSELWNRISSQDPDQIMPPRESNLTLSNFEKAMVAKWIDQGAVWKNHWAYIPPVKPSVPNIEGSSWPVHNEIDHFIQHGLVARDMEPSPPASKEQLIRRLSFDLRGLPPSLQEIDRFLKDSSAGAYEKVVDQFLGDEAYGERLAMEWMDVARYADSHGLHADGLREMWPWRDWVIHAFNKNLNYKTFATWQMAGDLLENATLEQKMATGFYRNQPLNSELGIVTEEFRLKYTADRTNTTGTAFMGLTLECASCHDHKFDPISQREYYEMTAFFNNVHELGMIGNDRNFGPLLLLPSEKSQAIIDSFDLMIQQTKHSMLLSDGDQQEITKWIAGLDKNQRKFPPPDHHFPIESIQAQKLDGDASRYGIDRHDQAMVTGQPKLSEGKVGKALYIDDDYDNIHLYGIRHFNIHDAFSAGVWINTRELGTFQSIIGNIGDKNSGWRGWIFYLDTLNRPAVKIVHSLSHNYIHTRSKIPIDTGDWVQLFLTYDGSAEGGGIQIYHNGLPLELDILYDRLYKSILPAKGRAYEPEPQRSIRVGIGSKYLFTETDDGVFDGGIDQIRIYRSWLSALEVSAIFQEDNGSSIPLSDFKRSHLEKHYLHRLSRKHRDKLALLMALRKSKLSHIDTIQELMVMEEMPEPRLTYVLDRGQYNRPLKQVFPNTPDFLPPYPEHEAKNRLGLARWLFSQDHPLTARVTVNRYWQMIFGRGLVDTPHDFGSQGELPTHPGLLDWLAIEFIESNWDLKALLRLMVTSATYRQSSQFSDQRDLENTFWSRGPSHRLSYEMIRDNALAASGLLHRKIGGPSVKPYQPEGLWKEKNEFSGFLRTYQHDQGNKLYRRSLYTFIRRTSPPPAMATFDVPDRDVCSVKRENTSTPLQALILLNDPQFAEAMRVLAERIQKEATKSISDQVHLAFRLLCGRPASVEEESQLLHQFEDSLDKFQQQPKAALEVLAVGEFPRDKNLDAATTAALTLVAQTILNFDETYMKR